MAQNKVSDLSIDHTINDNIVSDNTANNNTTIDNVAANDNKSNDIDQKTSIDNNGGDNDVIDLIDSHIHLWDINTCKRPWLEAKGLEDININIDITKYCAMYNNHPKINLKYGIFMETNVDDQYIDTEINEITKVCADPTNNMNRMIIKIDPDVTTKDFMDKVNKYKTNQYICGIRKLLINNDFFSTNYDNNNQIPSQFINNLVLLSKQNDINWTFDIVINIEMLQAVELLVKSVPNMIFVLNHMGNHHQICGNKNLDKLWRDEIVKLSKYNNLCVKVSALTGGLPKNDGDIDEWKFETERERVDFIIKHFNRDNVIYGSDWPPSILPLKKNERVLFLDKWAKNLYYHLKKTYGKPFCNKVFYENATRVYNL